MNDKKTGLYRNTIDKFYTKKCVSEKCVDIFVENIKVNDNDLIIEPSAGNGSFIEPIRHISKNCIFYDILPENREILKQDFLCLDIDSFRHKYKKIHVIGNPPFGRQSSLAIKFIKKSCSFADTVSFILPKSFKKQSLQRYFPLNFHMIKQIELDENSFLVDNTDVSVPCVFQVWCVSNTYRDAYHKSIPNKFKFVKKEDNPDISFRRVGVNAGKISREITDKSTQSHYFIKFEDNEINLEILKNIQYDFDNTVGPKSISKQELIERFNNVL